MSDMASLDEVGDDGFEEERLEDGSGGTEAEIDIMFVFDARSRTTYRHNFKNIVEETVEERNGAIYCEGPQEMDSAGDLDGRRSVWYQGNRRKAQDSWHVPQAELQTYHHNGDSRVCAIG